MIHTSYSVGITTAEYRALQSCMIDQKDWLTNAIQVRAKIAISDIQTAYTKRLCKEIWGSFTLGWLVYIKVIPFTYLWIEIGFTFFGILYILSGIGYESFLKVLKMLF